MKTLIFFLLLACCTPVKAVVIKDSLKQEIPKNKPAYEPIGESACYRALERIKYKYHKLPNDYFEFYPIFMFPFFFLKDTLPTPSDYKDIYLMNSNTVVRAYKGLGVVHLQVAVLHYAKSTIDPWARIYSLFFIRLDPTNGWQEERNPVSVVTVITKDGTYQPK